MRTRQRDPHPRFTLRTPRPSYPLAAMDPDRPALARSAVTRKPRTRAQLGVSIEQYEAMLAQQDGRCAIPHCPRRPKTRRFHVDHDHATGAVRGLLCYWHNRLLPAGVKPSELRAMACYLEDSQRKDVAA